MNILKLSSQSKKLETIDYKSEYHLCVVFDLSVGYKFGNKELFDYLENDLTTLPAQRNSICKTNYIPTIIIAQNLPLGSKEVGSDQMWALRLLKIATIYMYAETTSQTLLVSPEPYCTPYIGKKQSQ
eukprot:GHVT01013847.1.p1 GENE.GHVT01013847.1~~GHVT01013847.1.p1  ORF type:complete len:127 (-),score=2.73 GHVT01013847.1:472-852(-)